MAIDPLIKKSFYPYTEWPYIAENLVQLPEKYSFNLEEMRSFLFPIIDKVGLVPLEVKSTGKLYSEGYFGMGFTHRKGAKDPEHDAFKIFNEAGEYDGSPANRMTMNSNLKRENVHKFERHFTETSKFVDGPLKNLLNQFQSLITKVRVIRLEAGNEVHRHFDFPYYENVRLHAAIETNENVEWWIDDKLYQIPADGKLYWMDTGKFHQIKNKGSTARTILSIHLSVYRDQNGARVFGPETNFLDLIKSGKL